MARIPRLSQGVAPTLTDYAQRQSRLQNRRNFLSSQGRDTTRVDNRLQRVGNRMDALRAQGPQTGGPVTLAPTTPNPPADNPLASEPGADTTGVMPNQRMFEPADPTTSPLYQMQADEGQKRLERLMAARGLTKSGAEIQANSTFLKDLGATEAQRQSDIAMAEADRLERMQNAEANRKMQEGNSQFDRWLSVMNLMSQQSPMNNAFSAANSGASMTDAYGRRRGGQVAGNYRRVRGGGGGGSAPIYAPPFASGPDFSGSNIIGAIGSGAQQSPWLSVLPYLNWGN